MIKKVTYVILTILLCIGSYLAGFVYNHDTKLYDLYNQECWVGFCIIIMLAFFELKYKWLGWLWVLLLIASIAELVEQYTGINDGGVKGADYINSGFVLVLGINLIFKTLRNKNT